MFKFVQLLFVKMKEMNSIGTVLKNQGRTQKWLSEKIGMSPVSINHWCTNKTQPSIKNLYQVSKVLGVNPTELLQTTIQNSKNDK